MTNGSKSSSLSPEEKQTIEITNQANVVDYLAEFVRHGRTLITESDVFEIHRLTIENLYPCAGNYRTALTRMVITDTDHKPSQPSQVRSDVRDMLDWLENAGHAESPIHRASHVLWKTNAIHPFNGGNGRVARALAYLVISIEIAPIFEGEPLPAKLKTHKREYIEGLKAADKGNLQMLEQLVLACVQEQITEVACRPR
ncbi:MAG: Fic family protein [Candidatus Acidiferrales bacterium]